MSIKKLMYVHGRRVVWGGNGRDNRAIMALALMVRLSAPLDWEIQQVLPRVAHARYASGTGRKLMTITKEGVVEGEQVGTLARVKGR